LNRQTIFSRTGADLNKRLEQALALLMGLFVFLNPFPRATAPKEFAFYGAIAIALFLVASGRRKLPWRTPLATPLLLLILWSAAGIVFALDKPNSLHDILFHLVKYVAVALLLVAVYPTRRHLQTLSWIVILSTAMFATAAMIHFYLVLDHGFADRLGYSLEYGGRHSFFEMSSNYMGFITVFAAALSMNQYLREGRNTMKALLALCFIVTVAATLLTQTRGAVIGLILAILCFGMRNRRELLLAVLLPILVAAFIFAGAESRERISMKSLQSNERIGIALMYGEIIKEHPVAGIGFGMQRLQNKEFMTPYYEKVPEAYRDPAFNMSPHSLYVDVTVRIGFVGLFLYGCIIVTALRMVWRSFGHATEPGARNDALCLVASFGAFLVQAFFADASFGAPAVVFYLHLAMITILWQQSFQVPPGDGAKAAGARG
jgi:O-antigen ligase